MINVVFCIDAAFWQPLGVTLSSLLRANAQERFRVFVVSADPPPPPEWARLQQMVASLGNATVESIVFGNASRYAHLPAGGHLSIAMYLRLFMAEYLPADVDRVLYLDSDLLVLGSHLRQLWEVNLGNAYLGAAMEPYDARQRTAIGFGPNDFYFNSGVMLIQLNLWRSDDLTSRLLTFAEEHTDDLCSPDQDVLNCTVRGRVFDIGVRWNWQALFPRLLPAELRISQEEYERLKRAPDIVHFTSAYKPWLWRWEPHYKRFYLRAQQQTPWARIAPGDRVLRNVPVKARKLLQRYVEWYLPRLGRRLRGVTSS